METLRQYYEMRVGRRVADSHWSKIKKILKDANLELTEKNLNSYLEIKKYCPRYTPNLKILSTKIKNLSDYIGQKSGLTGQHFYYYLRSQSIKAQQPTISRWFQPVGGFKKDRVYTVKELSIVGISAFIYQIKNEAMKNG